MKLYVLVNNFGEYVSAFTDHEYAKAVLYHMQFNDHLYDRAYLEEMDIPFVGRYVYYIHSYRGYNYDLSRSIMYNVISRSQMYPAIKHAKSDELWKTAVNCAALYPDNFIIEDLLIATAITEGGKRAPFDWGDIAEGKFNTTIKKIRVDKRKYKEVIS